jgi:hypothetical protein
MLIDMNLRIFTIFAIMVILGISTFELFDGFHIKNSTGLLQVSSNVSAAGITISQTNHSAAFIGSGSATVRLVAGSYTISVAVNGYQTTKTIVVSAKQTVAASLTLPGAAQSANNAQLFTLLPYQDTNSGFMIDETVANSGNVSGPLLEITSSDQASKQAAMDWIEEQGYKPSNYITDYIQQVVANYHYTDGLPAGQ